MVDTSGVPCVYDSKTIRLHWVTAVLTVALWCLGKTIDWYPPGAGRIPARSVHICVGIVLGLILCHRIFWRWRRGRHLPPASSGAAQLLATFTHYALYFLLVGAVALGIANVWVRGDSLFGLVSVPQFDPGNKPLHERVAKLHYLLANALLIVAGVHAIAALAHHFLWKDHVLRRMMPKRS